MSILLGVKDFADKARSVLAQLAFRHHVQEWEIPFRKHLHVPEVSEYTGQVLCNREDEGHIFKVYLQLLDLVWGEMALLYMCYTMTVYVKDVLTALTLKGFGSIAWPHCRPHILSTNGREETVSARCGAPVRSIGDREHGEQRVHWRG